MHEGGEFVHVYVCMYVYRHIHTDNAAFILLGGDGIVARTIRKIMVLAYIHTHTHTHPYTQNTLHSILLKGDGLVARTIHMKSYTHIFIHTYIHMHTTQKTLHSMLLEGDGLVARTIQNNFKGVSVASSSFATGFLLGTLLG
jgi:hypothetical protein